ncbi:bestrophin family protein [Neptunomonas qingdaonensis]|uniref:Putative membrane protein n=1 Tax=Neptunomonas qingdaonensis TaxID=1045558 RepID=A0A1I2Q3F4_9GAMM|nr:bestrophin family ion channel [Neptunomonas qingdaonensis]SFG21899.1 putative membrane protein [Neptunomonas qingdaonensis]
MIVRNKPNAFQLFFILRGSVVPLIFPQILFVTLLGAGVAATQYFYPSIFPSFTLAPFALLGVALSLFLGFRNNACYDRWWEARKQWGQLIVDSRSLSRQVVSYFDVQSEGGAEAQKRMIYLTIAFNHALRHQLRRSDPWTDIEKYLEPDDIDKLRQSKNLPDALLRLMGQKLGTCRHKILLSDYLIQSIDNHITSMAGVQAACERIQNTPLPFAYMLLVQRTVYLYCFILPFGIVASLGLLTPLFCAIVAYTFFGLDALSEGLEEPFGLSANDLALTAMARSVEINLLEILGELELPEPIKPTNHRLE